MSASLDYAKDSLKRKDENVVEFKLINHISSGSGYVSIEILLDGEDVTRKSIMKIGDQEVVEVEPYMFVNSDYGDYVLLTIKHDRPIEKGLHKVKVICNVEMLGSYSTEFEGDI